ncbi:MAG: Gfo/Idh/MocA family oxidoreductase [Anaerolineae bacterium]|nr:Gfo/Idh/MocA family oxidoreductase [Anaerolineae bacterium]
MAQPLEAVMVGAGDRGFHCQGMYAHRYPHRLRYVAVAEPSPVLRDRFGDFHNIPKEQRYPSWQDLIAAGQLAPALVNTTPDRVHKASTVAALEAGYDVLLEKPMATSPEECVRMVQTAERTGRVLQIFHGMRYAPFFAMVREVLNTGRLGQIMSYAHFENVVYFHMAHAYVRGNWPKKALSGPIILTKCCHDLDLIYWYTGSRSKRIASFGSLRHYRSENARPDYPARCTDGCPIEEECPYYAPRFYLSDDPVARMMTAAITTDLSTEGILHALKTGPYGRCVYRCDNDVVDNQIVMMEMEDGTNVSLTLHGFSHFGMRYLRFEGTRGSLHADPAKKEIALYDHLRGRSDLFNPGKTTGGHGGGDDGLMSAFLHTMQRGKQDVMTSARASLESHLMAFAAEEARVSGQIVDMDVYRQAVEARAKIA